MLQQFTWFLSYHVLCATSSTGSITAILLILLIVLYCISSICSCIAVQHLRFHHFPSRSLFQRHGGVALNPHASILTFLLLCLLSSFAAALTGMCMLLFVWVFTAQSLPFILFSPASTSGNSVDTYISDTILQRMYRWHRIFHLKFSVVQCPLIWIMILIVVQQFIRQ